MASDDNCECPLCMEPFEVDDMSFYPCTCGYQICRFCWHRLKIDGNGLCPACRKAYSENPAHFEPLSEDEIVRIKKERRHKEVQKKQKLTENRRHLSDVRVVQKNLVFVVGLSHRLADAEILKKHEYFGKFGKITKVVINSSPSYAGAQTPSASAYVTYSKADEALKAIQTVNNVQIDNRVLKASLGTTKYCSHFLKGIQCPKSDCMYLHDLGEDNASFTKEQMSAGKHLEYESKLIENVLHIPRNLQNISNDQANQIIINQIHNGLPSALLTHSSNQQQQQSNPSTSSSSATSSTNSTSTSSNTTNSNSNHTDKNDTKSRLKKPTSSTSRHQHQSSKTSDTSSKYANSSRQQHSNSSNKTNTKNNNINNNNSNSNRSTNNNASLKSSSDLKNTTEEEDYDDELVSDEVISDEEVVVKQNGTANEKHTTEQQPTAPRINTTAKSYLSALNTDEASSNTKTPTTHTHVVQSINYKDMLEKNIPVVDTNEDQAESKKSNNVSPVPATVAKTTETVTSLPTAETVKQKPAVEEEEDTSNVNDHGHQGIVSDITHSLSTHHIVQEEDLGFDPWDEATKSLQDLMKIESSSHLAPVKPPFEKSASCEATPSAAQSLPHKSSTNPFPTNQSFNTDADTTRQYFQQQQQQPSMFTNTKVNDLQSFYRLQANGVITPEFNQLYQSHLQQQQQQANLASSDCNTSILQKLNEIMLNNAKSSSLGVGLNSHPFLNGASTNPASGSDSFATTFSHENYLNKLLLQKQSLSSKQSQQIAAPPGFNSSSINNNKSNGASFNSPVSTSSTSSSSSSTSSSVNNSTSTTPALNGNGSNSNGKTHSTDDFPNDQQEKSTTPHTNNQPQMNPTQFSNNLQDTFRSIFPNANISFGATKQQQQLQQQHLNTNLTNNYSAKGSQSNQQYADKQNCWPDDPAIVSLNNGFLSNGQLKASNNNDTNDLQERMKLEFDGLYSNPNKQLEQLSYLTSSLQQQQQQHQPNNINNLASLLKKQQNEQQFNNSFLSQFQMLYQQHQLAQFQQQQQQNNVNSNSFMTHSSNNIHSNNLHSHNSNNNSMNMNNKSNMNIQDQMNNANKSIEDLHNYQQKLLLLNNSHFNGLNGNSNTMLNNFLNNDLNQFANANMNNYGYLIDSNQNIAGSMKSQQNQMNNASASAAINNNNSNNGMNGLPSLLNMQQQSYMQQLLLQNYGQNPTTAAANLNSD